MKFNDKEIKKLSIADIKSTLETLDFIIEEKETFPNSNARKNSLLLKNRLEEEATYRIQRLIILE